jgi:hypothetical protein
MIKWLVLTAIGIFVPVVCAAQVEITIPVQHYKHQEEIRATVQNVGKTPITFCLEVAQQSPQGDTLESTPYPFWVQQFGKGKWSTLMNGPDIGSSRASLVLQAGEAREFPFRLNASGKLRLRMNYWRGSIPNLDCKAPPKAIKLVSSAIFIIDS